MPLVERCAIMEAIGASSTGGGSPASRARDCWNVSTQRTSGVRRMTWRRFQPMPRHSTSRMSALSSGLLSNAVSSAPDSTPATTATASRNTTMRTR